MKWGYILIGVSILILVAVLYGQNRRREEFTNMKGNFPNWTTMVNQTKSTLDKYYDYDASKLIDLMSDQTELYDTVSAGIDTKQVSQLDEAFQFIYTTPSAQSITNFMQNKELASNLPKGFSLNVDTPFDTRMAMIYAASEYSKTLVKNAKSGNDILTGYTVAYAANAVAGSMKNSAMSLLLVKAVKDTGAKIKPSSYISVISK